MTTFSIRLKFKTILVVCALFTVLSTYAQNKVIGNKPRSGSSRSSFEVVKGEQTGIKMNAGKKPVHLLKLSFGTENNSNDTLRFKVNIYEFNDVAPGENFVKQEVVGIMPKGKDRATVDLSPYNIIVKGHILVAVEWLESHPNSCPAFFMGIFNGGSYRYTNNKWRRIPVLGLDFNLLAKKIKKS